MFKLQVLMRKNCNQTFMEDIDAIFSRLGSYDGAILSQIVSKLSWPIIMHITLQIKERLLTQKHYYQNWMNHQNNKFWEAVFGRLLIFFAKMGNQVVYCPCNIQFEYYSKKRQIAFWMN